jgi:hypothetical protein
MFFPTIIDLAGKRPDKLDPAEIQLIKDFIIGASHNINAVSYTHLTLPTNVA